MNINESLLNKLKSLRALNEARDDVDDFSFNKDYEEEDTEFEYSDFGDNDVKQGVEFDEGGEEYIWDKPFGSVHQMDFDRWQVWSALNVNTDETVYFVVDIDTGFIDWGPVETVDEALEFLDSKQDDYDADDIEDKDELGESVLSKSGAFTLVENKNRKFDKYVLKESGKIVKTFATLSEAKDGLVCAKNKNNHPINLKNSRLCESVVDAVDLTEARSNSDLDRFYYKANDKTYVFECNSRNTRNGFAHDCWMSVGGELVSFAKCFYYNRTWEMFQYQTVMLNAIDKASIDTEDKEILREKISISPYDKEVNDRFKSEALNEYSKDAEDAAKTAGSAIGSAIGTGKCQLKIGMTVGCGIPVVDDVLLGAAGNVLGGIGGKHIYRHNARKEAKNNESLNETDLDSNENNSEKFRTYYNPNPRGYGKGYTLEIFDNEFDADSYCDSINRQGGYEKDGKTYFVDYEKLDESLNEDATITITGIDAIPEQGMNVAPILENPIAPMTENNQLGNVVDEAKKVMEAYQNANKWMDILKEFLFSDLGCPFFASYIHNLAHTMPVRFDKFGDILHTIDMKIPYPATQYIPNEPQSIDDVFNLTFMTLDAIKTALNDFIKCTDENYHGMSCAAETLLNDIEAEYVPLYKMKKAWTAYQEPMRFDRWVGTYVEKRADLNESYNGKKRLMERNLPDYTQRYPEGDSYDSVYGDEYSNSDDYGSHSNTSYIRLGQFENGLTQEGKEELRLLFDELKLILYIKDSIKILSLSKLDRPEELENKAKHIIKIAKEIILPAIDNAFAKLGGKITEKDINYICPTPYMTFTGIVPNNKYVIHNHIKDYDISGRVYIANPNGRLEMVAEDLVMAYYRVNGGTDFNTPELIREIRSNNASSLKESLSQVSNFLQVARLNVQNIRNFTEESLDRFSQRHSKISDNTGESLNEPVSQIVEDFNERKLEFNESRSQASNFMLAARQNVQNIRNFTEESLDLFSQTHSKSFNQTDGSLNEDLYRHYEDPYKLEQALEEAKERFSQAKAEGVDDDTLIAIAETIHDLEERVNFAWQDDESECCSYGECDNESLNESIEVDCKNVELDSIINWLSEHKQAWKDALRHFNIKINPKEYDTEQEVFNIEYETFMDSVTKEKLIDWIADHKELHKDFNEYFSKMDDFYLPGDEEFEDNSDEEFGGEPIYQATGFLGNDYRGVMNSFETNDFSELKEWVWEKLNDGDYIEVIIKDHKPIRIDPDQMEDIVDDPSEWLNDVLDCNDFKDEALNESSDEESEDNSDDVILIARYEDYETGKIKKAIGKGKTLEIAMDKLFNDGNTWNTPYTRAYIGSNSRYPQTFKQMIKQLEKYNGSGCDYIIRLYDGNGNVYIDHDAEYIPISESVNEDTVKTKDGMWTNKGNEGTHGKFKTKKEANAQRKAMFANGYKGESIAEAKKSKLDKLAELERKRNGTEDEYNKSQRGAMMPRPTVFRDKRRQNKYPQKFDEN